MATGKTYAAAGFGVREGVVLGAGDALGDGDGVAVALALARVGAVTVCVGGEAVGDTGPDNPQLDSSVIPTQRNENASRMDGLPLRKIAGASIPQNIVEGC